LSVSAGAIRAGATYVEIGADAAPMRRALDSSRADLRRWAQDASAQTAAAARASLGGSFERALKYGPSSLGAYLSSPRSHVPPGGALGYGDFGVSPEALLQADVDKARTRPDLAWAYNRRRGAIAGNIPGMGGADGGGVFGPSGGFGAGGGDEKRSFFSGGFRGMQLFDTALKFGTAVMAVRVAIKDVQMFSRLFQGDMEGARKAAEELPFGLGEIVKELSGPVDSAMKSLVFSFRGLSTDDSADRAAAARAKRDRDEGVAAWNRYVNAVGDVDKALAKATMSTREYAKYEVEGLRLAQSDADQLLAKKLQLIAVEEQQKQAAQWRQQREQAQSSINDAMDRYAKATMGEREFLAYQSRHMNMLANEAQTWLGWMQAALDIEEERQKKQKLASFEGNYAQQIRALELEAGVLRGTFDAFDVEVTRAAKPLDEAMDAGLISFQEYTARLEQLKSAMAELRGARDADASKKEGERVTETMQTPEERAKAQIEHYKKLLEGGNITGETYQRAIRKALEDAAAAMPDVAARATIGVRGTFSAIEAASALGAGGVQDRIAEATAKTAKNTARIAELAAKFGVTYTD